MNRSATAYPAHSVQPAPISSSPSGSPMAALCLAAAATVLAMFAIFVLAGIGQDPLQFARAPADYAEILLRNPPVLRGVIGLDNLFIVLYVSIFIALGSRLWPDARSKALLASSLGLLCAAGLLDLLENMHFLVMLSAAMQGLGVSLAQIEFQMWESLVKFHISYAGLFLLSFVLPAETTLQKTLCMALRWVQLPVGLGIYLVPKEIAVGLVLVRFAFFLFALAALALIFRQRKSG
jgi:hypothetical protein